MSWTANHTFTTGEVVTAAQMNVLSNNLDALNTRINNTATTATSQTRTNGAYGDLGTVGPTVTVTTGTFALVLIKSYVANNTNAGTSFISFAVSGATTTAASDANGVGRIFNTAANDAIAVGGIFPVTLTAGSNTFTAKYRTGGADTGTFQDRILTVIPQF